jgi:hypothetical protein
VAPDLVRPQGRVGPAVVERASVGGPRQAVDRARDLVGEVDARLQVPDAELEDLVTRVVGAVGDPGLVGRQEELVQREEVVAGGERGSGSPGVPAGRRQWIRYSRPSRVRLKYSCSPRAEGAEASVSWIRFLISSNSVVRRARVGSRTASV